MIADVIGSYLDNIEEREFDEPFIALLRAHGFHDIHFLHGSFEFGKDFIAKNEEEGVVYQYAFQTKAGDLGLGEWNKDRGQIDLLRTDSVAHPNFNTTLPRRAVFVTTGRLKGGAASAAQQYSEHLRKLGELEFVLWDRETLVGKMTDSPEVGLAGMSEGPLLSMIGKIDAGDIQQQDLEQFSRRWLGDVKAPANLWKSAVEAAVLVNRLRRQERLDLACHAALCLVRAAWVKAHGTEPPDKGSLIIADLGREMFRHYASNIFDRCSDETLEPLAFVNTHEIFSAFVTYPARCLRLIEILGLLGLLELETGEAERVTDYLERFLQSHPGAAHPISDGWAVSIVPVVLLMSRSNKKDTAISLLKGVVRWIGDRYERDKLGLAGPHANPEEEVNYLLGTPFEHIKLHRRSESYISTIVLDLAAVLGLGEVYTVARNDFLAVNAMACVIETQDSEGQYVLTASDTTYEPNMPYKDDWSPTKGWKPAPHHARIPASYYLSRIDRNWDHLALSSVLRDRHFIPTWRTFLNRTVAASQN